MMQYQELLNDFVMICRRILEDTLTGIYLHGSMAMGCFNAAKSDIDIIVIVEAPVSDIQKMALMKEIVRLNGLAPAKGLEISFVKREYCKPFVYPTPYELHFSAAHLQWFLDKPTDYMAEMKGDDKDLAAHFSIINKYGITLYGREIEDVFGPVPQEAYLDSIWYDIENAPEEIVENPMYVILNLCRVSAYLREKSILSKEKGGEWGIAHLPTKYRSLIQEALRCYQSERKLFIDEVTAREFARDMHDDILRRIHTKCESTGPYAGSEPR